MQENRVWTIGDVVRFIGSDNYYNGRIETGSIGTISGFNNGIPCGIRVHFWHNNRIESILESDLRYPDSTYDSDGRIRPWAERMINSAEERESRQIEAPGYGASDCTGIRAGQEKSDTIEAIIAPGKTRRGLRL